MLFVLALAALVAVLGAVASLALVALDAAGLIDLWAEYPTGPPFPDCTCAGCRSIPRADRSRAYG